VKSPNRYTMTTMMSFRTSFVTLVLLALSVKAVHFTSVPSDVVQCGIVKLSFEGGAPFNVSVWRGCNEDAETDKPEVENTTSSKTVYWEVNVASSKSIMFGIQDSQDSWDWSGEYTVKESNDKSCLGKPSSFSDSPIVKTTTTTTSISSLPTTQTGAPGNAGGGYTTTSTSSKTSTTHFTHSGALSNLSPRVGLAALVVAGSSLASLL